MFLGIPKKARKALATLITNCYEKLVLVRPYLIIKQNNSFILYHFIKSISKTRKMIIVNRNRNFLFEIFTYRYSEGSFQNYQEPSCRVEERIFDQNQ